MGQTRTFNIDDIILYFKCSSLKELGAISPRGALALRAAHRAAEKLETNTGGK